MPTTIACLRCNTLVQVEITDEQGATVSDEELTVEVPAGQGMLAVICPDCMTDAECIQLLRKSAAGLIDAAEEGMANMDEVIFRAQPHLRDHPTFKAQYTHFQQEAERARAMLAATMDIDEEGTT
jgi:hypothetical protein